ncbi:hypothetical protein [Rivularia sp. UHCC 0363]|uniref:hypothetical protein n=1 Tax=Rivularia sp. UHCC 0363 TaxID=3110244 RepID=UPI002B1F0643|nr:hypothetical protein [Rivularia sp. UHCC 0363]MEA5597110.1 hypothetical protein [Rivularia sp. UHCC 0363]
MDRLISQITGFISSIQSLFYRVEDGTRRTSQFAQWLKSFHWREDEDDDEDEETEE